MNKPKWFLKSTTIWGVIVTIAPTLLPMLGLGMDDFNLINQAVDSAIVTAGAILAAIGRFKAVERLRIK